MGTDRLRYGTRVAGSGEELRASQPTGTSVSDSGWALAREIDRLRGELLAVSAQLEAARASIEDSAGVHQDELESLWRELESTKYGLVTLERSASWRLTRPLRALRRLLR